MLTPQPMMAHIQIQQDLRAERDMVWSESNQLKQVFVNIIMNAADAMACDANPSTLTIKSNNNEDSIEIRFVDTGPGIRQENLAQTKSFSTHSS